MEGDRDRRCDAQMGWDLLQVITGSLLLQSGNSGRRKMGGFWIWSLEGRVFWCFCGFLISFSHFEGRVDRIS